MKDTCSLHCGHFIGVSKDVFEKKREYLKGLFDYVHYEEETERLEVTGAQDIEDSPEAIKKVFNTLATLLREGGKGRVMLQCENTEICYLRRNMWKLMSIHVPPDPFDEIYYVD